MSSEDTLSSAWEQHLAAEFAAQSPEHALATMTAAPYVNVVALMIGARGRDFSAHHCLSHIPPDMATVPVSRTIGQGRVVDELMMRFTHAIRMDWLLPGIAPTGTRVEVPLVALVPCEGDKVAHAHIDWDQASVLVLVGLLDRTLPVRGGAIAAHGRNPTPPMHERIRRVMTNTDNRWACYPRHARCPWWLRHPLQSNHAWRRLSSTCLPWRARPAYIVSCDRCCTQARQRTKNRQRRQRWIR